MKKELYFIGILFILILSITQIQAQIASTENQIKENIDKLENTTENIKKISDKDFRNEFLAQEWIYLLNKTSSGRVLISINDGVKKLNPFWNLVLGVNYSFSWGFWMALVVWLILFFIFMPPSEVILRNNLYAILASFAITSLIGLSGVIRKTTDLLGTMIENRFIAIIVFVILIILAVVAKKSDKFWQNLKEKEAKKKEKENREILEAQAESIKKQTKEESNERTTRDEF